MNHSRSIAYRTLLLLITLVASLDVSAEDKIVMPEYPGGREALMDYLEANIVYPSTARKMDLRGEVVVEFTVERGGAITGVNVIKGVAPELDQEAIRVVRNMPRWKPGTKNGNPVRVTMTMPINFKVHRVKGFLDESKETTWKKSKNRHLADRKRVVPETPAVPVETSAALTDTAATALEAPVQPVEPDSTLLQ